MELYIKELENKAEELKQQVSAKLSAVDFPPLETESHTATASEQSSSTTLVKTASVMKYLLLGGGAVTVATAFFDRSIWRNILMITTGTIELAAGVLALIKPDLVEKVLNKKCNTEPSQTVKQPQKVDLQCVKSDVMNIVLSLQNEIPSVWDSFLEQKKQYVLQAISQSNLDTTEKAKLNDLAIKRSIIKPVSENIESEISTLEESSAAYKEFLSIFEEKFFAAISSALVEQKENATMIAEKIG